MYAHPGKKLLFMGQEFAQFIEWDYKKQLDWLLLEYEAHSKFKDYAKTLNHFYRDCAALWQIEDSWDGFRWIVADDNRQNIIAFARFDREREPLVAVCNFSPVERKNYKIGVPEAGCYDIVLNTDDTCFGGDGAEIPDGIYTAAKAMHGFEHSIELTVPAMSALYLKIRQDKMT